MALSVINGDFHYNGTLSAKIFNPPPGSIRNDDVEQNTGIEASKLQQAYRIGRFETVATTASTLTIPVHGVIGAELSLINFEAGVVVPCIGDSTIDVDLLKNGTTVLSAPITLNSTHTARQIVLGTIVDTDAVADDVYEIDIVATIGTGTLGLGLFAYARVYEDAT